MFPGGREAGALRKDSSNYRGKRVRGIPDEHNEHILVVMHRLEMVAREVGTMPDQPATTASVDPRLEEALEQLA